MNFYLHLQTSLKTYTSSFIVNHIMSALRLVIVCMLVVVCVVNADDYHHKCYPKYVVKHHTIPVHVPYHVYEKYPVYKYEKYPVHVPVKYPVYVKVKDYEHKSYEHKGYEHKDYHGGDEDYKKA